MTESRRNRLKVPDDGKEQEKVLKKGVFRVRKEFCHISARKLLKLL